MQAQRDRVPRSPIGGDREPRSIVGVRGQTLVFAVWTLVPRSKIAKRDPSLKGDRGSRSVRVAASLFHVVHLVPLMLSLFVSVCNVFMSIVTLVTLMKSEILI